MFTLSEESKLRLKYYINHDNPFGPIKAEDIDPKHSDVHQLLFEENNSLYVKLSQNPKIIIGRKGAGKTAYLTSVYLNKKYDFIVDINTADTFVKVIECISDMLPTVVFSEKVADLWKTIIDISVMENILRNDEVAFANLPYVRDYLAKIEVWGLSSADEVVWKIVNFMRKNLKDKRIAIIAEALSSMSDTNFSQCRQEIYNYLETSQKRVVVLIDTLDDYNLDTQLVKNAIAGLLKCVGTFNTRQHSADIRFCIPSELYHVIASASSNPAKDLGSEIILHWHPRELILLASRRFQLYLYLYYLDCYSSYINSCKALDKDSDDFEGALSLLKDFMPNEIVNGLNFKEETIIYLLRHTQLIPRHFLLILNNAFKHKKLATQRPKVNRNDIVKGVTSTEALLAEEIFTSFKNVYGDAKILVERCIPELPFKFDYSVFCEVFQRVGKPLFKNGDAYKFMRMFIEMGIIGKHISSSRVYHEAMFEYTVYSQLNFSSKDTFCIHPLFLNKFSAAYTASDGMTVYPFGTNPHTVDDYRLIY